MANVTCQTKYCFKSSGIMNYFLIYIDILGFSRKFEGEKLHPYSTHEEVRSVWRNRIDNNLKKIKQRGFILHFQEVSSDSWILFSDTIDGTFRSISELLKSELPLEIAVGFEKYPISPASDELIYLRDETMTYLKDDILGHYKEWFKKENMNSVNQTCILLTTEAYEMLDDINLCCIPYVSANFYLVKPDEFEKKVAILEFLEKIGSQRAEYKKIEELYVEPKNYNKIKTTLNQYNIVFIIGDAEMGKTYTAIKLLKEYSKEYEPLYIPEERRIEQWKYLRHNTEFEGKVIYLEDPWGKVEFERAESLYKEIGTFLSIVKRTKCKVIITSREKVFKEFEKRKETRENLWGFVNLLKVDLSYSVEDLKEILIKYIQVFEPAWKNNSILKTAAFESVGKNLRTPMSIKKLIDSSKDITNMKDLKLAIEEASIETRISFAKEIKEMFYRGDYDNIAFLSFPYIGVNEKIAKSCYTVILKDLGYVMKGRNFDDLIKEFSEVEISISGLYQTHLRFIHLSYADAFGFALIDNCKPNNICIKIFSNVLLHLSEQINASYEVARTVELNFDKLPENVRNELLIKTLEKSRSAIKLKDNPSFLAVSQNILNIDIFNNNNNTFNVVSRVIANNFDNFPDNVRNRLLLELSKEKNAAEYVAWTIANNFDKLPTDIGNLLFEFLKKYEKDETSINRGNWESMYEGQPRLFSIAAAHNPAHDIGEKDIRAVARAVEDNFDKLPENVRNKLLSELSKMEADSAYLARTIVNNFTKIPEKIRNNIIINLSTNQATAANLHDAFKFSYGKLPTNVRNVLNLNLGLGGVALENLDMGTNVSNDKSLNFMKKIILLDLLERCWDYNNMKLNWDGVTNELITFILSKKNLK